MNDMKPNKWNIPNKPKRMSDLCIYIYIWIRVYVYILCICKIQVHIQSQKTLLHEVYTDLDFIPICFLFANNNITTFIRIELHTHTPRIMLKNMRKITLLIIISRILFTLVICTFVHVSFCALVARILIFGFSIGVMYISYIIRLVNMMIYWVVEYILLVVYCI